MMKVRREAEREGREGIGEGIGEGRGRGRGGRGEEGERKGRGRGEEGERKGRGRGERGERVEEIYFHGHERFSMRLPVLEAEGIKLMVTCKSSEVFSSVVHVLPTI